MSRGLKWLEVVKGGSLKAEDGVRSKYQKQEVNLREDWGTEAQEVKKRFQQIVTVLAPETGYRDTETESVCQTEPILRRATMGHGQSPKGTDSQFPVQNAWGQICCEFRYLGSFRFFFFLSFYFLDLNIIAMQYITLAQDFG